MLHLNTVVMSLHNQTLKHEGSTVFTPTFGTKRLIKPLFALLLLNCKISNLNLYLVKTFYHQF